jgi:GT2 family glycosyltransferase
VKVKLFIPTRGDVWWETAARVSTLWAEAADYDLDLEVQYCQGNTGVLDVRNRIMRRFLDGDGDVLWMIDDDVVPGKEAVSLVWSLTGKTQIVAAPCPVVRNGVVLPNLYSWNEEAKQARVDVQAATTEGTVPVDMVGFGCVMLGRPVCEKLKEFKTRRDSHGQVLMSEDLEFCLRARSQGMVTMADPRVVCEHMVRVHANGLALAYANLMGELQGLGAS